MLLSTLVTVAKDVSVTFFTLSPSDTVEVNVAELSTSLLDVVEVAVPDALTSTKSRLFSLSSPMISLRSVSYTHLTLPTKRIV